MKAALLREYNQPLELVDRQLPELVRADEVRVRIEAAGVCATDVHAIDGHMEAAGVQLPRVLGHENAGRVDAIGELVSTVTVGDPVLIYPPFSCGLCVACRRGDDIHCDHHDFVGLSLDGGFAEYLVVRERSLVPLPPDADLVEIAPHADAGITAYHAVKRLAPLLLPGRTAVVLGVGGVGHIGLQLLRELGSSRVVAVDPSESRRKLATDLGADEALDSSQVVDAVRELTGGRGADVILDCVGIQQTHDDSLGMLAKGGTYGIVGYGGTITIPSVALVAQEQTIAATLVGSWTDLWEVLQLHHAGRLTLKTETHRLEQINEVLDRLREGEVTGRAILTPCSDGAGSG
jgi:NAD+-dependent secondary alcohol dehydrogenase Adh1